MDGAVMGIEASDIDAMIEQTRGMKAPMLADTFIYDGVVFELNDAGDGYVYDDSDPRAADVVASLRRLVEVER